MALMDNFFSEFEVRGGRVENIGLSLETYEAFWQRSDEERLFIEAATDPADLEKGFLGTIWGAQITKKPLPFGVLEFTGSEDDLDTGGRKEKLRSYRIFTEDQDEQPKTDQAKALVFDLLKDLRDRYHIVVQPGAVLEAWSQMILAQLVSNT